MSRIGKQPITLPQGVEVSSDGKTISVKGPKGTLEQFMMPGISVSIAGGQVLIDTLNNEAQTRAKHGLLRSLVNNMVTGVNKGFEKKLELHGVGYRVAQSGQELRFNLGFSHEVVYKIPTGVEVEVQQNVITVKGINKQVVGQAAAEIRALKKPEPYKGKGIRYADEHIIRKSGKSGKE